LKRRNLFPAVLAAVGLASLFSPLTVAQAVGEPTVTGVSPATGAAAGGTSDPVVITGTLFVSVTKVSFGTQDITTTCSGGTPTAPCFTASSTTSISVPFVPSSPDATQVKTVHITVTNAVGTSTAGTLTTSPDAYTWLPTPTVTAVNPSSGPVTGGSQITVSGTNFTATDPLGTTHSVQQVKFGSTAVTSTTCPNAQNGCFILDGPNQITVQTPPHAAGAVDVTVVTDTHGGGTGALTNGFTYSASFPTVTGISPTAAVLAPGNSFTATLTGTNLSFATSVTLTKIGDVSPTHTLSPCGGPPVPPCFTVANQTTGTEIDITGLPTASSQENDIVAVITAQGTSAENNHVFTYANQPAIATLSAATGSITGGNDLMLTGTDFEDTSGGTVYYTTTAVTFTHSGTPTAVTATCGGGVTTDCFSVTDAGHITVTGIPGGPAGTSSVTVTTVPNDTSTGKDYIYTQPPAVVASVTPVAGRLTGGDALAIVGTNFSGSGYSVKQLERGGSAWITSACGGGTTTNCFTVTDASHITAVTPSGSAGTADVTVDTISTDTTWQVNGTSNSPHDDFVYVPVPTVTAVSPTSGGTGTLTQVVISGTNFVSSGVWSASEVDFGTVAVTATPCPTTPTSPCFTVNTANNPPDITAFTPPHGAGTVDVHVVTPGGTSATSSPADQYTYIAPTPVITSVTPNAGPVAGGTSIVISGTGFTAATSVAFGTTSVTAQCPQSPGTACFTVVDDTTIDAVSPAHSAGTVDIKVTTGPTSATGPSDTFTYAAVPTVTGVSPTTGPMSGGTTVTITGTNFSGGNIAVSEVDFGGGSPITTACTGGSTTDCFSVTDATHITAFPPASSAGTVDVQVITQGGTSATSSADQFIFNQPAPTVSAVSPSSGPTAGGTSVTVTGTNFSGSGFSVSEVDFGSMAVTATCGGGTTTDCFTLNGPTSLTVVTPSSASVQTVDVTVTTVSTDASSTATSATSSADQYTFGNVPAVTGVSPTNGPTSGGNAVTITGSNLSFVTAVDFGSTAITTTCSSSHVDCFVPGSTIVAYPPGGSGTVDVRVVAPDGTSPVNQPADQYTFVPMPTITGVSPSVGPAGGGTAVTVTGTQFSGSGWTTSEVDMGSDRYTTVCGGSTVNCFTVSSATSITVHTRSTSAGDVDVRVITPGGTSAISSADIFTFVSVPTVDFVLPPIGLAQGGLVIAVFGSGFTHATSVHFGSTSAPFVVVDDNVLVTLTPPSSPGTVDITVTNAAGSSGTSLDDLFTFLPEQGYWMVGADGGIFSFGSAGFHGSTGGTHLNKPIVGMAPTLDGAGYWMVASDGGIFAFGDAPFLGSMGGTPLNKPIVGMAPTIDGGGYWLVASDGGIFAFGDAPFFGSTGAIHLNQPIVGMTPTPDGGGYWLVASDGGIFAFGDAPFFGSTGAIHLNKPIVGMASTVDGGGYWLVASDGGIFAFGDAPFLGSTGAIHLNKPIVAMTTTEDGGGYRLVASDGGIFSFGDAEFHGSTGSLNLNSPIVGIAAIG